MKTLPLAIIALCYLANTFAVYETESGGISVYFGNFGYHFETESN